jgi:biopolymer transport protein ExbD
MQRRPLSMVTDPNVVPMIDVLLVLLIIFMLGVVVLQRRAFDLQLPEEGSDAPGAPPLILSISKGPHYTLNGRELPSGTLESSLRDIFRDRSEKILFVKGERSLSYQEVVRAFDAARGAGIDVTAIVPGTQPPR